MPTVKVKENEPFDVALRRFKRSCEKAGVPESQVRRGIEACVDPLACEIAGRCGGCARIGEPYAAQLAAKLSNASKSIGESASRSRLVT